MYDARSTSSLISHTACIIRFHWRWRALCCKRLLLRCLRFCTCSAYILYCLMPDNIDCQLKSGNVCILLAQTHFASTATTSKCLFSQQQTTVRDATSVCCSIHSCICCGRQTSVTCSTLTCWFCVDNIMLDIMLTSSCLHCNTLSKPWPNCTEQILGKRIYWPPHSVFMLRADHS